MIYRKLMKKRIGLLGSEKICADLKEFFNELQFEKILISEKVTLSDMDAFTECDCILVGEEYDALDASIIKECPKLLFTLEDIYRMVDELETFYIDKRFSGRPICVYGSKEKITEMIVCNSNLRIDYVILDKDIKDKFEISTIELSKLRQLENPFVIIAENVSSANKTKFLNMGFEFGSDFHFYNHHVPNHPTSYYLQKTLLDVPKYTMPCDYATRALSVKAHGNVMACCSAIGLSMGNYLYTSIEEILQGIKAQLIRLSINNRTYSFCGEMCFMFREKKYCLTGQGKIERNSRKNIQLLEIKDFNVQLGYDRSCNLACPSCRNHRITKPEDSDEQVAMMHEEVKKMCKKHPKNIRIGNGELFFSPYYKDIVFHHYEGKDIALISNGILFTPENWEQLEVRYKKISLEFSVDAVNDDTYKKLRGGNLAKLRKNLEFAGQLRRENKLSKLTISFVIQVENYKEMVDFVKYGKSIGADFIHFMKLNSWGHIHPYTFTAMDVYDERNAKHKEFVEILRNPIFRDSYVHVDNIDNFIGKGE